MNKSEDTVSAETKIEAKRFSSSMPVSQIGDEVSFTGFILFGTLGSVPGFLLGLYCVEKIDASQGWMTVLYTLGALIFMVLTIIGAFAGFTLYMFYEEYLLKKKGKPALFNKNTLVTIDENGLNIEELGLAKWSDVLSLEGIPDADHALIVYTTPFGKLMLHHDVTTLAEVLNFHLSQNHADAIDSAQSRINTTFEFKAVIFHWPTFFTWILAAYLIGIAVAVGLPMANPYAGFFKNMVGIFVAAPICWGLVWTIPLWQISLFAGKRTKAFDLTQDRLVSKDRTIEIDLHNAKVTFQHKTGIGYTLDFMTVKPQKGRRLDLLLNEEEIAVLQKKLIRLA